MYGYTFTPHKGDVHHRRVARAERRAERRERRAVAKAERLARSERGPVID